LGLIEAIAVPSTNSRGAYRINSIADIGMLHSDDSGKKADIYLNGVGVSVKQAGSIFGFNRLQRALAPALFKLIGFDHIDEMLAKLDEGVRCFHVGGYETRSRPWSEFFVEDDFKTILEYLMMKGSPKLGLSQHPAELILEAGLLAVEPEQWQMDVYTFDEYYKKNRDNFTIAIRRSWYGQASDSEHNRAKSLINNPDNAPWVFNGASGTPTSGWRSDIPASERKTVYYLMFETIERGRHRAGKLNISKQKKKITCRSLDEFGGPRRI
jgi:hypothetical protein